MRKIAEIRMDLKAAVDAAKALDPATQSDELRAAVDKVNAIVEELNAANEVEAAERALAEQRIDRAERVEGRKFSFAKFIREAIAGKFTGVEATVVEEGAQEYQRLGLSRQGFVIPGSVLRATVGQNVTTAADGGNLKEVAPVRWVELLKEKLVLTQLGATFLSDLVGDVPVVRSSEIAAAWGAEGAVASTTKAAFAKATLSPHRNFISTAVSKDLIRQTSLDVEGLLLDMMVGAHANLIEAAAIAGSGSSGQPTGIINNANINVVAMGTNGGAISWAKVVEMESVLNSSKANRGSVAYLTNPKVWGAMKVTPKAQGGERMILEGDRLNGYKADFSNLVPANLTKGTGTNLSAMIFGNFRDLYIGQWGGIDIVIDPYTRATSGEIVMTLNAWNDAIAAEPKSFVAIKDIVVA